MNGSDGIKSFVSLLNALGDGGADIFLFFTVPDIFALSKVCKHFYNVLWVDCEVVWTNLALRDLFLVQNIGLNDVSFYINLKNALGIDRSSTFYYVFKNYHRFHSCSTDLAIPKVNIFNFIGCWRSVPQSFSPQHYRGGLMTFVIDTNETTPRVLLQFINAYNIVYRTFWVHYYNDKLVALAINSYISKTYTMNICPNYSSTQFDYNEQVNMPSVAITLTDAVTMETEHVLMQIYTGSATPSILPQGLYNASYGKHGIELVYIYNDEITGSTKALKIIGDENVPSGKISFVIRNKAIDLDKLLVYDTRPTYSTFLRAKSTEILDGAYMHNLPPSSDAHTLHYNEENILLDRRCLITSCYAGDGNTNERPYFWLNTWQPLTLLVYDTLKVRDQDEVFSIVWEDKGYSHRHYIDFKRFGWW